MMLIDEGHYVSTEYYWDDFDNEYTLEALWFYERNYPEAPDSWILEEVELIDKERAAPDIDTGKDSEAFAVIDGRCPHNPQRQEEV